jgi:hypothetical protein
LQDGRTSTAMLSLFERLRKMVAAKQIAQVVPFMPTVGVQEGSYERQMAQLLIAAHIPKNALVVALVGNAHARKRPLQRNTPYQPMGRWLPQNETLILDTGQNVGASWNCIGPSFKEVTCAARDYGGAYSGAKRGIVMRPNLESGYSGIMNFGRRSTASSPAISAWSRPPPLTTLRTSANGHDV